MFVRHLRAATACAALALGFATALAADPVGPPIGNTKYRGAIGSPGDTDDFVGRFFTGDKVSVVLTAERPDRKTNPSLKPTLSFVDPSGIERYAGIVPSPDGFGQMVTDFPIDLPGPWAVRVGSLNGTQGDYQIQFRVKPVPKSTTKKLRLGDELPFSRTHEIPAFEGAVVNVRLQYTKLSTDVAIRSLTDPSGNEVLTPDGTKPVVETVTQKGTRLELRHVVLSRGNGTYRLRVRIPTAAAQYDLTIDRVAPARPTSNKKGAPMQLSALEPQLDPRDVPLAGLEDDVVEITGANFSVSPAPKVLFGTIPAKSVTTSADGSTLTVVVPARGLQPVVPVYVQNPDGQGVGRDRYFAFVPPPVVEDLLDAATSNPIRTATTGGGRNVRLLGQFFDASQTITIGGVTVVGPTLISETEFQFKLPALPQGNHTITVSDTFARSDASDFTIFFKTPPAFAAQPYSPGALKVATATTVTVSGTGFEEGDQLFFNGSPYASTFVNDTTRTFVTPQLAAGNYPVRLVDSIGTIVDGPTLDVKSPPTITVVTVVAGDSLNGTEIPILGGSTIQVDGTNFAAADQLTFGGTTISTFSVATSTRRTFVAPAHAAGLVGITITDGAGQIVTANNVLRYVGYVTAQSRVPAKSSTDDLSSVFGVAADLDRDGAVDDVVLSSPYLNLPGTRTQLTRLLIGDGTGTLVDRTATGAPVANGSDQWDAVALAVGDIDRLNGNDILIGGTATMSGQPRQVRLWKQGATAGTFSFDSTNSPPSRYSQYVYGRYYWYGSYYNQYTIYGSSQQQGTPQAIAVGDIDLDNDLDVVVGTDHFQMRHVYYDPSQINFSTSPPTMYSAYYSRVNYDQYLSATRLYENRISNGQGLQDGTTTRLPKAGTNKKGSTPVPAFHARDVGFADLDVDGDLDLIVAWDHPRTVTAPGLTEAEAGGSTSLPQVATRVLTNVAGRFTDNTASWMPASTTPEYWHARKIALADLDNDNDNDLILLLDKGLDAWTGTETQNSRALRVLRNDRSRFVDVTGTALPGVVATTNPKDDFSGSAIAVRDVNGDGLRDIVISTKKALKNLDTTNAHRLRVFYGLGAMRFSLRYGYNVGVATDTGEADQILFVGDLGGAGKNILLLMSETLPVAAPNASFLRAQEWTR